MGNLIKYIGCIVKGHVIDSKESIISDVMINPNNLLCPCHRCGFYIGYDSMSGIIMPYTKKGAYKLKAEFIRDMGELLPSKEETIKIRKEIYGEPYKTSPTGAEGGE